MYSVAILCYCFKYILIFQYDTLVNLAYFYSYRRYSTLFENLNLSLGSLVYFFAGINKMIANAVFAQQTKLF